ncbi:helix-turn-helix domain-containing protein [Halorubrum ezzemoulense]|uniref:helix-turn-helix domain-containing protein n=1 Tax=Halorubrum ezzemoulense TaxID=337243 RepID=UPI0015957C8E|nr:helix-turn-helix domain-containing protein [Halorubrum ezzemoulense]
MSIWDDRILELLSDEGPQTPSKLAQEDHIHVGASNISRRLSKLADHDLVDPLGNGVYQITRKGRIYLVGGLDAESGEMVIDIEGEGLRPLDWTKIYVDEVRDLFR